MDIWYPLISVIIVSLLSIVVAIPFLIKKKLSNKTLLFLLSISVGVLLSTVVFTFLPELFEQHAGIEIGLLILLGFLVMFVLEKFIHWKHNKECDTGHHGHSHAYNLAPLNILGDAIHNFIDGIVIAASYAINVGVGIATTISIIFHEIPQEIADMGVLLYAGLSRKKAVIYNLLSASTAIIGTILGVYLLSAVEGMVEIIIPFAAGNFIYIAAANLTPQLHRHCKLKDTLLHVLAIFIGIAIIVLVTLYAPTHTH